MISAKRNVTIRLLTSLEEDHEKRPLVPNFGTGGAQPWKSTRDGLLQPTM
jgi:hypothetical protein